MGLDLVQQTLERRTLGFVLVLVAAPPGESSLQLRGWFPDLGGSIRLRVLTGGRSVPGTVWRTYVNSHDLLALASVARFRRVARGRPDADRPDMPPIED